MSLSRGRLFLEVSLAALLGLLPLTIQGLTSLVSNPNSRIGAADRFAFVVETVTFPGRIFEGVVTGAMDGYGLTAHARGEQALTWWGKYSDSEMLWRIEAITGAVVNMCAFGLFWSGARSGSAACRRRGVARALLVLWLLLAVPAGLFGAAWMTG